MSINSPKPVRFRPWDGPSPLAAKRRRLDSSDTGGQGHGDDDAASHCLRVSPIDSDMADTADLAYAQKPSPSLKTPLLVFAGETPPPAEPAQAAHTQQTGTQFPPVCSELPTDTDRHCPQHLASSTSTAGPSSGMQASLVALEADSQAARLAHAKRERGDKSTASTYKRHVDRYEKWWMSYQAGKASAIPGWTTIPAFPITAAKASMYLGYESTREKKKTGSKLTIPNSNVGKESISQSISALENWRFDHAHHYRDIPEAQTVLRSDARVKTIEKAKRHDEPKRVESSQALKATGSSSGQPFLAPVEFGPR